MKDNLSHKMLKGISLADLHSLFSPLLYTSHVVIHEMLSFFFFFLIVFCLRDFLAWIISRYYVKEQVPCQGSAGVTEELSAAKKGLFSSVWSSSLLGWFWHHFKLNQLILPNENYLFY